jgi:molybdate transport system substrate-binding protein
MSPNTSLSADLKVLAGSAVQPVLTELLPEFEATSGHRVVFDYGTVGEMADRAQRGEAADIVVASRQEIESLERLGKVIAGSRVDLAKLSSPAAGKNKRQEYC